MTKVMCKIDKDEQNIFFDCMNHAGDREVCIMCSTICNVLIAACESAKVDKIMTTDAHVQICIDKADEALASVFEAAMEVFQDIQYQFPDSCKVY